LLAAPGSKLRARIFRGLLWTLIAVVVFAAVGFLLLPVVVKPMLERDLSTALGREAHIGRLDINPFALSATLRDVSIGERGAGAPMLTLDELYLNAAAASLFRWAPVISELKVSRPALNLIRNSDKTYSFSDLIEQAFAPGPTPRFSISNIEVVDGRVTFDDRPEHRQYQVTELKLGIPFLSSLPRQTQINVEPRFSALVNGRRVAIDGETRPFEDTHETRLHWDLEDLPLDAYVDYLPVSLPFKVEAGRVSAKLDLTYVGHGEKPPQLTLAGTVHVADVGLREHDGSKLVRIPSLSCAIDRLDLVGRSAELRSISADGVELELRREKDGALNLASLAPPSPAAPRPEAPFRFRIGTIGIDHGTVRVADATVTPPFAATLTDVAIAITNLASTTNEKASLTFSFGTDSGAHFSHHGTFGLAPAAAAGRLEMTGMKLDRLFPYYASALNLAVDDGTLDGSTEFSFDGDSLKLSSLGAKVSNVKLRLPDEKEPLWLVPVLAAHGGSVDVAKRTASFESVEGRGAVVAIRRDASGALNFGRLVRTQERGATEAKSGDTWRVEAHKVTLDDIAATFADATVDPPAFIALSRASLNVENLSNTNAKSRTSLQATLGKRGTVSLTGPLATAPLAGTLSVVGKDIDLVPFQPYLSRNARVLVTGGTASLRGTVDFATAPTLRAGYKGDLTVGDLTALDEASEADLLKWKALTLASIDAQLQPLAVEIGDIALNDFYARLILNESGEFNLQQLGRKKAPATAPPTPTGEPGTVEVAASPGAATTWLKLGKARLEGGNVEFTDHFIRPNYSADVTGLSGSLSTLAFDQPADIELHGKVQGSAPVEIAGRINPLGQDLFLDVKASATDIELPPLSPYSGKYVGYGIEKGKLSMKVSYLVDHRKLKAENSIVLNQLTFGEKVDSPDAIKVPVLLAVALLKDRDGVIRFDLPVSGSLDDPQFSVGALVFRALVNLIVKVVASPFALLGSLGGSHGEELAYVEFAPGSAAIDEPGEGKVKAIAKALNDRPAVKLDIAGRIDPAEDKEALKHAAVEHAVKVQKFNDLVKRGEPPSSVDAVQVTPDEYDALLTRAYKAADFDKPKNALGFPKDLPRAEMEALLSSNASVSDEELRALADQRAQAVRASLIDGEHVASERVFLVAPRPDKDGIKDKGKPTRVDFALH
jgi:hypothetical protein